MSYNFSFVDNAVYSAADVNKITSRLVTSGIEDPFTDGVPYNLSAFNDAGMLLYTDGALPETVNTLKVVKANEEGKILIYPGTAFFRDGAVIEIENGGEILSYTQGAINYVYLKNDLINQNACYPVCSTKAPAGDCVLLAEISENGEITDKRTYAKGKLPGYQSVDDCMMQIDDVITPTETRQTITKTYNIGNNRYTYLLTMSEPSTQNNKYCCLGIYNFETATHQSFSGNKTSIQDLIHNVSQRTDVIYLHQNNDVFATAEVALSHGTLTLKITYSSDFDSAVAPFPIKLYLF